MDCDDICAEVDSLSLYETYRPDRYNYVISIDIGIRNLAIVFCAVHKDYTFREIVWFDLIDITTFQHRGQPEECKLFHAKTMCDYLEHVFQMHQAIFDAADHLLIERQPPQGLVAVEQLIFSKYRHKAELISPNAMHSWMGWRKMNYDYEQRKIKSVEYAAPYLRKDRDYLAGYFEACSRQHDIADAICLFFFWLEQRRNLWLHEERKRAYQRELDANGFNIMMYLDTKKSKNQFIEIYE